MRGDGFSAALARMAEVGPPQALQTRVPPQAWMEWFELPDVGIETLKERGRLRERRPLNSRIGLPFLAATNCPFAKKPSPIGKTQAKILRRGSLGGCRQARCRPLPEHFLVP
jgi:hypothetical protein